jgi:hypothetical protein
MTRAPCAREIRGSRGKAIEPRRIGSYLESMSEDEARVVIDLCSDTSARLAGR